MMRALAAIVAVLALAGCGGSTQGSDVATRVAVEEVTLLGGGQAVLIDDRFWCRVNDYGTSVYCSFYGEKDGDYSVLLGTADVTVARGDDIAVLCTHGKECVAP